VSIQAPEYAVPAAVDGYHHEAAVLRPTQSVLLRGLTGLVEGHEGACGAFFTVHIADDDRWTPLWRADVSVDSGCQVVESGPMVVVMEPGHDYAVGLGWDCATYTALQQKGSHHARTPLGRHRGAVGLHYASDPEWRAASCMLQPMTVEYSRLQVGGWGPALTWSSTEPADRLEVCEDSFRRSRLFMPDPSTFPRLPPPRR